MSNWFEDHPARTIIFHTIFVAATVWAISTYILDDSKIRLKDAQLETARSITEQYKARSEILTDQNRLLNQQLETYRKLLKSHPEPIPLLEEEITRLNDKNSALQKDLAESSDPVSPYKRITAKQNHAIILDDVGITLSVSDVSINNAASLKLVYPDDSIEIIKGLKAGDVFYTKNGDQKSKVTVISTSFIGGNAVLDIKKEKQE